MNYLESILNNDEIELIENKISDLEHKHDFNRKQFYKKNTLEKEKLLKELNDLEKSIVNKLFKKKEIEELTNKIKVLEKLTYTESNEFMELQSSIDKLYKDIEDKSRNEKERHKILRSIKDKKLPLLTSEFNVDNSLIDEDFDKINIENLVLVHATNMFPINNEIKPASDKVLDNGVKQHRLTTHFSINGRVGNHKMGSWDDMPYIIIEPFEYHIDEMESIVSCDTFKIGPLKLSDKSIILVRKDCYEKLSEEEKNNNIVLYEKDSIEATLKMLIILGYKPQTIGEWGWSNTKNDKMLRNLVEEKTKSVTTHHSNTVYSSFEHNLQRRDKIIMDLLGIESIDYENLKLTNKEIMELLKNELLEGYIREDLNIEEAKKEFYSKYGINKDGSLMTDETLITLYEDNSKHR